MQGDLYFDGIHEDERGFYAVICSTAVDGNIADVYGETAEEAEANARELIALVTLGEGLVIFKKLLNDLNRFLVLFRATEYEHLNQAVAQAIEQLTLAQHRAGMAINEDIK